MRVVHADHVIVPEAAPLADGAIVLDDRDTILAVGEARDVFVDSRHALLPTERIHGVVLPGLVNAHVHVELSALRGRVEGGRGFVPWVKGLIAARAAVDELAAEGIEDAVRALRASGTVAVGEVTNGLGAVRALARARIGGVAFHEVFSIDEGRARARIAAMAEERTALGWPESFGYAVAPHTLYTLGAEVVRDIVQSARTSGVVTSLHLAEHPGERRALEQGEGPVIEWLSAQLGIDAAALSWPRLAPIAAADALGALGPHVVLVHLTDARPDEIALVRDRGARVVLCPRSNLHIESSLPPLLELRRERVPLALGTDSLASNASLDVLAEAKELGVRFPAVPANELVSMATLGGARALGMSQLGTVGEGLRPGLVAVEGVVDGDPAEWLLRNLERPRRIVAEAFPEAP